MVHRKHAGKIAVPVDGLITQIGLKVLEGMVDHLFINGLIVKVGREIDNVIFKDRVHRGVRIIQDLRMTEGGYNLPLERAP